MDYDWNARRVALQQALVDAALALCQHTGAATICAPIPDTTPPVYIAVGEAQAIRGLLPEDEGAG